VSRNETTGQLAGALRVIKEGVDIEQITAVFD